MSLAPAHPAVAPDSGSRATRFAIVATLALVAVLLAMNTFRGVIEGAAPAVDERPVHVER